MDNFLNDSVSNGKTADAESRKLIYILIFKASKDRTTTMWENTLLNLTLVCNETVEDLCLFSRMIIMLH